MPGCWSRYLYIKGQPLAFRSCPITTLAPTFIPPSILGHKPYTTKFYYSQLLSHEKKPLPPSQTIPFTSTMQPIRAFAATILVFAPIACAGPAAYGVCQAGCAAVVMACYGAAGCTWGATLGASAPATIIACNAAFGVCQAACWVAAISPGP
ncbi:hypothetical protein F5Y14DRAFT_178302 [Nemania sp. NC0429]|nr:hypothetical protein F5Y14DRAFT_178302 [Nemania sp. NC0429]